MSDRFDDIVIGSGQGGGPFAGKLDDLDLHYTTLRDAPRARPSYAESLNDLSARA